MRRKWRNPVIRYGGIEIKVDIGREINKARGFLFDKIGSEIGLTEEFIGYGGFRYRLKENPSAMGVWIPYHKALELLIKAAKKKKDSIEDKEKKASIERALYIVNRYVLGK